jgi:hypothetical protein
MPDYTCKQLEDMGDPPWPGNGRGTREEGMKHIKTPVTRAGLYILDADGSAIAAAEIWKRDGGVTPQAETVAHLDGICAAVNAHDDLVTALTGMRPLLKKLLQRPGTPLMDLIAISQLASRADAALKAAGVE